MTRRQALCGVVSASYLAAQNNVLTARQVIERIQKNVGVPWRTQTVDTFKAGDPETPVKGIATSFSATLDVLQRGARSGKNLFIVHEPTFYNHEDQTRDLKGEVLAIKQNFIEKNGLVVWRFHDHWHARRPDGILAGMTAALGWEKYRQAENPHLFVLPPASLESVAGGIRDRMKIRTLRVIGDPRMTASRMLLNPGFNDVRGIMRSLDREDVDAVVIGETREWEGTEYARDAVAAGRKKGLIILGHVPSEERGMEECAKWLRTFVPEVPVEYLPGGEPFWAPK